MVGYTEKIDGFRVWISELHKLLTSKNVKFLNENVPRRQIQTRDTEFIEKDSPIFAPTEENSDLSDNEEDCSCEPPSPSQMEDRKSTRLNSSHPSISYAVFCLKKKKRRI